MTASVTKSNPNPKPQTRNGLHLPDEEVRSFNFPACGSTSYEAPSAGCNLPFCICWLELLLQYTTAHWSSLRNSSRNCMIASFSSTFPDYESYLRPRMAHLLRNGSIGLIFDLAAKHEPSHVSKESLICVWRSQ